MRRQSRLGGLFVLLLVGLITPVLVAAPAQATSGNAPRVVAASGTPFGISKGAPFAPNLEAEKALGAQLRGGASSFQSCAEPGYVQAFDSTAGGGHVHSSFPGLTITAQTFSIILQRGVVYRGSKILWIYRWDNDLMGFNYLTTRSNENCLVWDQDNPLPAQVFPIGELVTVSACFASWELNGATICGFVGYLNRVS